MRLVASDGAAPLDHVAKLHPPRSTILRLKPSQRFKDTGHAAITT